MFFVDRTFEYGFVTECCDKIGDRIDGGDVCMLPDNRVEERITEWKRVNFDPFGVPIKRTGF